MGNNEQDVTASGNVPSEGSYYFTSESVTEGHPDKICDQISDAVLDAILEKEARLEADGYVAPNGQPAKVDNVRCACETFVTTGTVVIAGEIRTQAYVDVQRIARDTLRRIGYDRAKYGFDCDTCGVINMIHEQSPDIAQGVDESFDAQAAGLSFSLDFELNTGRGGNRVLLELEPEPSAGNVSLTCEGMDDDFTAAWNPDTAKWDKPLPAKQQGK